jgi:glycine dehydrogenase subunit 1
VPYVPNTDEDRREMLREIGAKSFDDLIVGIPRELRTEGDLDVPGPLSELELTRHMQHLAAMNRVPDDVVSFLGGGIYDHATAAAVGHITGLPHFYTAYTPYQAEVSQGTLQAIYEFQSLITRLTGFDVANASLYDGATAGAEAVLMATAISRRKRVLVSSTANPALRSVLRTYLMATDLELVEIPMDSGVTDVAALEAKLENAGAVLIQHPNFFGLLEPVDRIGGIVRESGAPLVASVDPVSLALLKPPSEYGATIAIGEAQSLGVAVAFGGPLLGFIAAGRKHARRMPGRIIGATSDAEGRRGYVMTLQTREQHIRREKATSNICTNQGLVALAATVQMSLLGRAGLSELALQVAAKTRYAAEQLSLVRGIKLKFGGAFFREFVIELPFEAGTAKEALSEVGIWPGIKCGCYYDDMPNCLLVSVTERHSREDIDSLVSGLEAIIVSRGA